MQDRVTGIGKIPSPPADTELHSPVKMHPRAKSPILNFLLSVAPLTSIPLFFYFLKKHLKLLLMPTQRAAPAHSGLALNTGMSLACSSPGEAVLGPRGIGSCHPICPRATNTDPSNQQDLDFLLRFTLNSDYLSAVTLLLHLFYHPMLPSSPACLSKPLCAHRAANYILNQEISL